MSEPALDLGSTIAILRRSRRELMTAAMLGVLTGVVLALFQPVTYSSTSVVLFPTVNTSNDQEAAWDQETQVRIATSQAVLGPAGAAVRPAMSMRDIAQHVEVSAPTPKLLVNTATAETADSARSLAQAVANSEVAFVARAPSSLKSAQRASVQARTKRLQATLNKVNEEIRAASARRSTESPNSAAGQADATALSQLTAEQADLVLQMDQVKSAVSADTASGGAANVIQAASPAVPPDMVKRFVVAAILGMGCAAAVAAVVLVLLGLRDRKLHYRDDIADAVGSPVVASVRSRVPRDVAGWSALLENYAPSDVDSWALRQALRQLVFGEGRFGPGQNPDGEHGVPHPASITVITVAGDTRGLAVGPQLASYAASVGVRTRLLATQGHEASAALWAACAPPLGHEELRHGLLVRAMFGDGHDVDTPGQEPVELESASAASAEEHDWDLTVVLAVVSRRRPQLQDMADPSVTVLAVSPGSATAEDLARIAVAVDDAGGRIAGVIVADPDRLDPTTGRLLQHERNQEVPLPIRLSGMARSASGTTMSSRLRRRPR